MTQILGVVTQDYAFREALTLAPEVRAELAERLIGSLAEDVSPEITSAQLAESGEAKLMPGDEVLARARRLLTTRSDNDRDVAEALRRDAEIEHDSNQAMSLAQLDSQIQNRRK